MKSYRVSYRIRLRKRVIKTFEFHFGANTGDLIVNDTSDPPDWSVLAHQQCPHCPLESHSHPHCPLAVQLAPVIDGLHDTASYDEVDVEVQTASRTISQSAELQQGIASRCPDDHLSTACQSPPLRL